MKLISNKTWKITDRKQVSQIKAWLLKCGGREDTKTTSIYEDWRLRFSDATVTYYKKGTLFITDSGDEAVREFHAFVDSLAGSRFRAPSREWVIGFDEAGKGEVLGPLVLAGVAIPRAAFAKIETETGSADTKKKHSFDYWSQLQEKIRDYRQYGVRVLTERIFPREFDKYNINKFLDFVYQRMVLLLTEDLPPEKIRVVIDDYGTGVHLNQYLAGLKTQGAEVIITTKADDTYLESRVASLAAKCEQQGILEALSGEKAYALPGVSLGSGNAGDPATVDWLQSWKDSGKRWPWFVKASFKNIRELDGLAPLTAKVLPPVQETRISPEFRKSFDAGRFHIEDFALFCRGCSSLTKTVRVELQGEKTAVLCGECKDRMDFEETQMTLRAYCDRLLPDAGALSCGVFTRDLEGERFFEGFTFLMHPECEETAVSLGGKDQIEKLDRYATLGLVKLEDIKKDAPQAAVKSGSFAVILAEESVRQKAIVVSRDKVFAGSHAVRVFHIQLA